MRWSLYCSLQTFPETCTLWAYLSWWKYIHCAILLTSILNMPYQNVRLWHVSLPSCFSYLWRKFMWYPIICLNNSNLISNIAKSSCLGRMYSYYHHTATMADYALISWLHPFGPLALTQNCKLFPCVSDYSFLSDISEDIGLNNSDITIYIMRAAYKTKLIHLYIYIYI